MSLFCRWRCTRSARAPRWVWWCELWPACLSSRSTFCCPNWWGNCWLILSFPHCKPRISDVKWMTRSINTQSCTMYFNSFNWHSNIDSFFHNICTGIIVSIKCMHYLKKYFKVTFIIFNGSCAKKQYAKCTKIWSLLD